MSFPLFRFTLSNTLAGSIVIDEPGGWDEATFKLERSEEYHSLIEYYDQSLLFYGISNDGNGGMEYINAIEDTQGPDAQIQILIEISFDEGDSYETAYDGLIDIVSFKQTDFYKQEGGIIRNDFWQKFINRKGTDVDLSSTTDLDGGTRAVISSLNLTLPSQAMRQEFIMVPDDAVTGPDNSTEVLGMTATTFYLIFANSNFTIDEITERFDYGTQISDLYPPDFDKYLFKVTYGGDYLIQSLIAYSLVFNASKNYDVRWFLTVRSAGVLTETQVGLTNAATGATVSSFGFNPNINTTLTLNAGDEVFIYGKVVINTASADTTYFANDNVNGVYTTLFVRGDTLYPETTSEAFTVFNAGQSVLTKLVGADNVLVAPYISTPNCGGYYGLTRGLNVRGYSFAEKPFFMSFDMFWGGINPILNLGLGYTKVLGVDKIEIAEKEDFYNPTPLVLLDFVNNIERSYNDKLIFKSIDVGYEKWSAESGSGIDDPQTKRTFRTRFKTVGADYKCESKFYAASLGIEQTRRNVKTQNDDWKLDEDVMIIALSTADIGTPELGSYFSSISNLLNADTRYNVRISATRNFKRWLSFLNGCLKWYSTDDDFTFASGEGNFTMESTLPGGDCESTTTVVENGTLDGGADQPFDFVPIQYDFVHPLTWEEYKTIRDNRKNAIGVSRTNTGHVTCFIMNLEYKITQNQGSGKFTVLLGQSTPI